MPALDGMTGIVIGAVFGSLFILTCIISAIKAVRDRSMIKKRLTQKNRETKNKCVASDTINIDIEEKPPTSHEKQQNIQSSNTRGVTFADDGSDQRDSLEHLDLSIYSIEAGVDNLTFKHSTSDMIFANEIQSFRRSQTPAKLEPLSKGSNVNKTDMNTGKKLSHLPKDCLAIQKSIRRHSYEVAIGEDSWLPKEPKCFSKSQIVSDTHGSADPSCATKISTVAFENKAYETMDFEKM